MLHCNTHLTWFLLNYLPGNIFITGSHFIFLSTHLPGTQFCDLYFLASEQLLLWILFQMTASSSLRGLFLFVWKRVHGLNDVFVARFAGMANFMLSVIFSMISFTLGHHRGTMWFVCMGTQPVPPIPYRLPYTLTVTQVGIYFAGFVHLIFTLRLCVYKIKETRFRR